MRVALAPRRYRSTPDATAGRGSQLPEYPSEEKRARRG